MTDDERAVKREYLRRWQAAHPGYGRDYMRKWRSEHPERSNAIIARHTAKFKAKKRLANRAYWAKCRRAGVCYACGGAIPKVESSKSVPVEREAREMEVRQF